VSDQAVERSWGARWIAAPSHVLKEGLPLLRRVFQIDQAILKAEAAVCGLGHFELRCNGRKVGRNVLEPGWSDYAKTCLYVRHDLTPHLHAGENVLGLMLGNGMHNVTGGRYAKFKRSFGPPKAILRLKMTLADGSSVAVVTDARWRATAGPITFSCIYGGEDYDCRREHSGWDSPGFDDGGWVNVEEVDGPDGELIEQISPPVREARTLRAVRVTGEASRRVFDLGRNFAGMPRLCAKAPAGTRITLMTGELLDEAGKVTQKNTGSPVKFSCTIGDSGTTMWQPRFSYTGFRYVQAEVKLPPGAEGAVEIDVEGCVIRCSADMIGQFECSDPLLNRIHALILGAIDSNLQSVLTDCPHREKLGWLEQAHLMAPALLYNYELRDYYRKICRDMRDAQAASGCVPTIAPQYTAFVPPWDVFNDSPEWGSAIVLAPWQVYQFTGDRRILEENYDAMRRYVSYLASRAEDGIIAYGLGDWYDVGPDRPGFSKLTTLGLTATAIYYADLVAMAEVARVLGRDGEAGEYADRAAEVRRAFNARFFDPNRGEYDTGSQTANAMPLALGLVEDTHRPGVLEALVRRIRGGGHRVTAGDIGFRYVLEALSQAGRADVVYDMLTQRDGPGYAWQLERGATTLTEAWDADPRSSQNHMMLGHAEMWFYRYLAGIDIDFRRDEPARITIKPAVIHGVGWVRAHYRSVMGEIGVGWEREGDRLRLEVTIPPGAKARIYPPGGDAPLDVGSGTHRVESSIKPQAAR